MEISIDPLVAAVTVAMAVALVVIAKRQLGAMNRTSRAAMLERLDARASSQTIKEARLAVEDILSNATRRAEESPDYSGLAQEEQKLLFLAACSECINHKKNNEPDAYNKMLEWLDFLETMGYLCRRNYVKKRDALEVYSMSVFNTWQAFDAHIATIRKSMKDQPDKGKGLFEHLQWLAVESEKHLRALATKGAHNL